jgi:TonB family protein
LAGSGGGGKPSEAWILPAKGKKAPPPPPPAAEVKAAPTAEEVRSTDEAACFGDGCTGEGKGSGAGVGDGLGGVIAAEDAARKPRWIRNLLSSADYPRVARQAGKDGRVILQILLDERGRVSDVRLLSGAYEALNEVALRKVKHAVFTPAYNAEGRAVPCRVTLPIRFELK